ncbi:MAG: hypothetical protein IPM22_00595 [Betaproteobacteria bacterium]|nr:hypothetical protein [Betaproteobacteria bacterium]
MNRITRSLLSAGTLAVLLPLAPVPAMAATLDKPGATAISFATDYDRVIDAVVAQRVAQNQLTTAQALVAREQMQIQFRSLSAVEQRRLLAASRNLANEEAVLAAQKSLQDAVVDEARNALAEVEAAKASQPNVPGAYVGPQPKLGADGDYVFVPTTGPCRVADSRFAPAGQLGATAARQLWGFSNLGGYDFNTSQGGTGIAGSGNCTETVYPGPYPVSVVATIAVVNTLTQGSMRAWNGGTTLTVGGVLGWNAGDLISNTTVIPMDRSIPAYPGSGGKRDFGLYNNSGGPVDFVVDVVGYFIMNRATALDCTDVFDSGHNIPANNSLFVAVPACPAGYTNVVALTSLGPGLYTSTLHRNGCRIGNLTGGVLFGYCGVSCCRVPGR